MVNVAEMTSAVAVGFFFVAITNSLSLHFIAPLATTSTVADLATLRNSTGALRFRHIMYQA